jgi:hypothetical protein
MELSYYVEELELLDEFFENENEFEEEIVEGRTWEVTNGLR